MLVGDDKAREDKQQAVIRLSVMTLDIEDQWKGRHDQDLRWLSECGCGANMQGKQQRLLNAHGEK